MSQKNNPDIIEIENQHETNGKSSIKNKTHSENSTSNGSSAGKNPKDIVGNIINKEFEKSSSKEETKFSQGKQESLSNEIVFYKPIFIKNGDIDIIIINTKLIELFYSWGFRRYDIGQKFVFIKVIDNVISQVSKQQILDELIFYIDNLPDELLYGQDKIKIGKHVIKEKIYRAPQNYSNDQKLSLLRNKHEIIFNADTKNECFIYYKNGFVVCNKYGWELKPYSELKGFIWHDQIIQRSFIKEKVEDQNISSLSVFAQFMFNVSGIPGMDKDEHLKRFHSFCSITGYLLSSFTDTIMKAIIVTDSSLSDASNGRTGKTLFGETFKYIKKTTQIPGKDFDHTNKNKYQQAELDTQIIFLNDLKKNFDFEVLYNDITEGIKVEKKNESPFVLKTKMCISTNKTIKIEGDSSLDRCIEFEFSNHYRAGYGPDTEFNHRFFTEWNKEQWNQFDNFMMFCLSVYLGNGIIKPNNINLNRRKILDETNPDFVEFMDEKTGLIPISTDKKNVHRISSDNIINGDEISKHELQNDFLDDNPELREDKYKKRLETFTKWMKVYVKYDSRITDFKERKSGKDRYCTFTFQNNTSI